MYVVEAQLSWQGVAEITLNTGKAAPATLKVGDWLSRISGSFAFS
jgi:hypothetical protein